jgi:DNA-binding MarR family transcriptional regulator/N-acetylglutamate synthase-like GNAT family acetyltransferase
VAVPRPELDRRTAAVRRFNRFYTRQIGLLRHGYLRTPFSVAQARVLYEVAHRDRTTAAALAGDLRLDPGSLSRILVRFAKRGLVDRRRSATDGRERLISLTRRGRAAFRTLNARSHAEIGAMLRALPPENQRRLVDAMRTIESVLGADAERTTPYLLRPHRPGDMGWVVHRHGVLYAEEYGWDEQFEALVAGIVARFLQRYDPRRERCWIAEKDGERVGSVFLVKKSSTVAQLRLLLVEPRARGLGVGRRLVEECIHFARQTGYRKITLWTNRNLHAARRIYEAAGFRLVHQEPHHSFGHDLIGQTWELRL